MIVIRCPECEQAYELEDGAIPLKGRKVRCTACNHVWRETPKDLGDLSENPAVAGLKDVTKSRSSKNMSLFPIIGWSSSIIIVVLFFASPFILPGHIKSEIPPVQFLSDLINMPTQKKKVLAITNSKLEWDGDEFKITADVFNASNTAAKPTDMKITVINDKCSPTNVDKSCILKTWDFAMDANKTIAPNGVLHIETETYQEIDGMSNVLLSF